MNTIDNDMDLGADLSGVDASDNYTPFPPGDYPLQAVQVELGQSSTGNNMVKAQFEITSGEHAGRKVFENFNIQHPNHQTVEIALKQIKQWVMATGGTGNERLTLNLLKSLEGREFQAKIAIEKDKSGMYGDKNRIRSYKPLEPLATMPAQQPAAQAAGTGKNNARPWE